MDSILITGVSSGIGLGLAEMFLSKGYKVFGSVRNIQNCKKLSEKYGVNFIPLIFDIQHHSEIDIAEQRIKEILGKEKLSAIINNIGYAEFGPLLHVPTSIMKKHFNILVLGQLYIIQKFFPYLLSSTKSEPSRIINISSISGVNAYKFAGCYVTCKHAFEGMSKTLRIELKQYGIKVIVIAPGNIITPIWDKQIVENPSIYNNTDYFSEFSCHINSIKNFVSQTAMTVEEFLNAFYKIFQKKNPAERYTIIKQNNKLLARIKPVRVVKG